MRGSRQFSPANPQVHRSPLAEIDCSESSPESTHRSDSGNALLTSASNLQPIAFATSNPDKAAEVAGILDRPVTPLKIQIDEVQGDLEEIAFHKLRAVISLAPDHPIIATEDVSLGYQDLGGFPGAYVKWLLRASGGEGLARIGDGLSSRRATATCIVALWDGTAETLHRSDVDGEILAAPRGELGFGWDAWFRPDGSELTYGEMSADQKRSSSHRRLAWEKVARHLR